MRGGQCAAGIRVCGVRAEELRIIRKQASQLNAVRKLIAHAKLVSPSPSMHVYIADLERALGMDAPRPHKTGGNG